MPRYSIGVDMGGTNLRAAAISEDGKMIEKISGSTPLEDGPDAAVADIVGSVRTIQSHLAGSGSEAGGFAGIGIGVPGFIRMETGVIAGWANNPAFNGYPMRDRLHAGLGTDVILENDANAAALGETWMGAGQGVPDLVLLTLGTGIGGGIIIGGQILHGAQGMAAELGHITVAPNGNPCGCGNRGCVEKHASATAIAAMGRLMNLGPNLTSEEVYDLARAGNERALAIFRAMGESLGVALATLINIFNFPLYLISGGPVPAWPFFSPSMLQEVERRSFTYRSTKPRIEPAKLGNEAGLYGAAYLPFQDRQAG